jgi:uncharacterized lipoprotein YddW (UPF0748 family)
MNRRIFCTRLAALALSSLWAARRAPAAEKRNMKNWSWIPVDVERSPEGWKRSLANARDNGIHAVLAEIYDGRYAYFASRRLPVKKDLLAEILPIAQAQGLEVHAWMWSMPCMVPAILDEHPDWYNVNALGESATSKPAYVDYYKFLDPGRPEVREWVQGTVKELGAIRELTGIHLDYIRHPDAILPKGLWKKYGIVQDRVYPQYDYGYSRYERTQFEKKFGVDPIRIGRHQLTDPRLEHEWSRFQLDMVVDLVNDYLAPAARSAGKMITAAVFPGPSLAREMVRQDWQRFQLDGFLPMLYNTFYETGPDWVGSMTKEAVQAVSQPVYSGLYVQEMKPQTLAEEIRMAMGAGASGVSMFSLDAMSPAQWKVLREAARSTTA